MTYIVSSGVLNSTPTNQGGKVMNVKLFVCLINHDCHIKLSELVLSIVLWCDIARNRVSTVIGRYYATYVIIVVVVVVLYSLIHAKF